MRQVLVRIRRVAIFCHRWMGLTFCVLFAWWFASGIFMMYWDYPSVGQADRLDHAEAIDASRIRVSPEEAFAKLGGEGPPGSVQLAMFDGRPVYRFTTAGGRGGRGGRGGSTPTPPTGRQSGRGIPVAAARSGNASESTGGFAEGRSTARGARGTGPGRRGAAGSGRSPVAPRPTQASEPPPARLPSGGGGRGGFAGPTMVYADDGSVQGDYSKEQLLRVAAQWATQPGSSASVEEVTQVDQWTLQGGLKNQMPLQKYTFPDGQEVYLSPRSGDVVQSTTLGSRIGAELGPIPHWLYYTPLRVQQKLWSKLIIYASGAGTIMALLGLAVGISMYSPSKRYRMEGAPSPIPYTGRKRLHMILGLFFGVVTCTWAFSGMLSMDPFPVPSNRGSGGPGGNGRTASPTGRIQAVLRARRLEMSEYAAKPPLAALAQLGNLQVKQLDFTSFDDQPVYVAALSSRDTRIVPVQGDPRTEYDKERIFEMVSNAARPFDVVDKRVMTQYDRYYLDRHRERPLPVLFVKLNDPENTQLYIDPIGAKVVGEHSDASSFVTRWLYHGLHSMDFPWLYNYRPAWDIVVLTLMLGGLALCLTSIILGWGLLRRMLPLP